MWIHRCIWLSAGQASCFAGAFAVCASALAFLANQIDNLSAIMYNKNNSEISSKRKGVLYAGIFRTFEQSSGTAES
ncbi:hypothetical protein [Fournierella sp.]|uniref:hypothetical protein n=1 Tax=Allofournierella sp. TaxID=1940256 RepID=UPI003079CA77